MPVATTDQRNDLGVPFPDPETTQANARLISAAPEMYEMLNSPFLFASLTPYLQVQVTMILNKINQP